MQTKRHIAGAMSAYLLRGLRPWLEGGKDCDSDPCRCQPLFWVAPPGCMFPISLLTVTALYSNQVGDPGWAGISWEQISGLGSLRTA